MNKQWTMRKFNEGKKSSEKITTGRIKKYLTENPKTTGISRYVLEHWHLSDKQISALTGYSVGTVSRFRKLNILRMNGKLKKKGSANGISYKSSGKREIRNAVYELLLDKRSPKEGIVPTLPFNFDFEKVIVSNPKLKGLQFWGFEFPYNATKRKESLKQWHKQHEILSVNSKLSNRVTMFFKNINDVLENSTEGMFAHVFADYCGTLMSNESAIRSVFENKIVKVGGIVWITISPRNNQGRKNTIGELLYIIEQSAGNSFKSEKIHGANVFRYTGSDSGAGSPMYAVAFRRVK
ncbi:MAG TPA: hypothetical protein PLF27_10910 [Sedimentibacter sp.]|jgi:hypothetical protein|nr:hypothetical protein [Sedimentibacter sp.]